MKVYFIIPAFNEESNLDLLYTNLINSLPGLGKFYVFINDGSTDKTQEIIQDLFKHENFILLQNPKNQGPGYSFNIGFEWVLNNNIEADSVIVTMEADNTSDLDILPVMINISNQGFDLVLASVYAQGGGFDKTSFFRKVVSFIANLSLRYFFDIKILTLSSFYRVYKIELIQRIKSKYGVILNQKGFICMVELLLKAIRVNASVIEVPMVLHSIKRKDKSKMKLITTALSYLKYFIQPK